jgi:16S rRNA (uracil1498-N3)-methyltransferase
MPRYLVENGAIRGDAVDIDGALALHLARSLRVATGERIVVVDDSGREHGVVIATASPERVHGRVAWSRPAGGEPQLRITAVHALIREFDDVVAGLTHAGVTAIQPVLAGRGVIRLDGARAAARQERWRAIAAEAAQLAGRARVPEIAAVADLERSLAALRPKTRILACVVDAPTALTRIAIDPGNPLALVIGPEGGFDPAELAALSARDAEPVHLGARVFPARSAGAHAATIALTRSGDLDEPAAAPPWPS